MVRFRVFVIAFLVLVVLPIGAGAGLYFAKGGPSSWHEADWSSSGIAPDPTVDREAIVQIYAARTGGWKGVLAVHTWIALKRENAPHFDRFDVVGWGRPVRLNNYPVDGRWYSNIPKVIHEVRGQAAKRLIPQIEAAVVSYPFHERGTYKIWPGPNSNTFVAWVARSLPDLGLEMPATAVGKDFMGPGFNSGPSPSGTGWQFSYSGLVGATLGRLEGFELNLLGLTIGLDPQDLAIKLPAFGRVGAGLSAHAEP